MMGENRWTPGPWKIWEGEEYEGGGADLCIGRGDTWLANMDHRTPRCPQIMDNGHNMDDCDICSIDAKGVTDEQRANAHLIAAAPVMAEAIEAFLGDLVEYDGVARMSTVDKLRDALARARGE